MADDLLRIGSFNESGRGAPVQLTRPGPALPFSPLVRQAYAPSPRARIGWAQGVISVAEAALDEPSGVALGDSLRVAAARLRLEDAGFVCVLDGRRFVGVVYVEALLKGLADDRLPETVNGLVSAQIPTCTPESALVDAVRQMVACHLRRIPVVGEAGELVGLLPLSAAATAAERDPAVRDVLESAAQSPSLWARRWR